MIENLKRFKKNSSFIFLKSYPFFQTNIELKTQSELARISPDANSLVFFQFFLLLIIAGCRDNEINSIAILG